MKAAISLITYKKTFIFVVFAYCLAECQGQSPHDAWIDELNLRTRDKLDELSRALPKTDDPVLQKLIVKEMAQFVAEIKKMQSKINHALSKIDRDKFVRIFGKMNKQTGKMSDGKLQENY